MAGAAPESVLELLAAARAALLALPPAPRGYPGSGEHLLLGGARGALAGAWCGAAAGPLDWGCAWQAWPVPQAWGAAAGFLLGALLALALGGGEGARARVGMGGWRGGGGPPVRNRGGSGKGC